MRLKVIGRYVKELSPKLESEYIKNRKELKYRKKTNLEVLHETSDDLANKVYHDSKVIIILSTFSAMFFLVLMAILKTTASIIVGMSTFGLALFVLFLNNTIANHVFQRLVEFGIEKDLTKQAQYKERSKMKSDCIECNNENCAIITKTEVRKCTICNAEFTFDDIAQQNFEESLSR